MSQGDQPPAGALDSFANNPNDVASVQNRVVHRVDNSRHSIWCQEAANLIPFIE